MAGALRSVTEETANNRLNLPGTHQELFGTGAPHCAAYGHAHGLKTRCLQGIATELLGLVVAHARAQEAQAVYLHVVTYNEAAIAFYRRNHFVDVSLLRNFYFIS